MSKTEIQVLRNKLLALGQPIIIPAREQKQPDNAADDPPKDITIYPIWR